MSIDHDRCSELIAPFVRGELAGRDAAEVREHLDGCDVCSAEERAVRTLLAPAKTQPMSEIERARLHRRLEDATTAEGGPKDQARRSRAGWNPRIAAWGASAAVLAVVGGFLYLGLSDGGNDDDLGFARGGEGGGAAQEAGAPAGDDTGGSGVAPEPTFIDRLDRLTDRELEATGRRGSVANQFATAYGVDDVVQNQARAVGLLADQAPEALREQIRRCADVVFEGQPQSLPASGRRGTYQGRTVLVLTFAWSDEPAGPLDRFMVWAWPEGGSCDTPIAYRFGTIKGGT
ncbi:MAG: zf-HC2 domain-containing protein [Actinomycetota bacterium]